MKNYLNESLSAQERAEALVNEMTVEEAASKLRYDAPAVERLGIPAYNWWNEGIHGLARSGVATMFPQAIGLAAMFDTDLVFKVADITSTEARAKYNEYSKRDDRDIYKGLTLWAPNINIFRDPRWGRGHETYGEDPYLTAECGKAYVKGLQGSGKVLKTAACAKHFAVHSGPEAVRHEFNAEVSWKDLEETYLYAFEELVKKAKVEGVMGAYNRVNGEPSCASEFLMGKLDKWGFDGYFVSDCWAIRDFHEHHMVTSSPVESAAMALKAGCNVNCGCTYVHLLSALDKGLVTEDEIRASCVALMRTRIRLGMFDKSTEYDNIPYSVVSCPEHKAVSYQCAVKSMVLLKNKGILPLDKKSISTIAVIGPNADSRAALEGNYNGTADRYVTFLEGIEDAFEGRVLYAEGCHLYKDRVSGLAQAGDRYAEAEAAAANSDVVILCVAFGTIMTGVFSVEKGVIYTGRFNFLGVQLIGVLSVAVYGLAAMTLLFVILKHTVGIRVSEKAEIMGLDRSEHGWQGIVTDDLISDLSDGNAKSVTQIDLSKPIDRSAYKADGKIRKVVILMNSSKFESLKDALDEIDITGMTVTNVNGCGIQKGSTDYYRGSEAKSHLLPKIKVEIVISTVPLGLLVDTVKRVLYSGNIGDGKIFVYEVENVIKIRTDEEGKMALE